MQRLLVAVIEDELLPRVDRMAGRGLDQRDPSDTLSVVVSATASQIQSSKNVGAGAGLTDND